MAQIRHLLSSPIEYLKGVGPLRAELLQKELGIFTFDDLLNHFPFRYIDRTKIVKIRQINGQSQFVQFTGKLLEKNVEGDGRNRRLKAYINDGSGEIELVWFQGQRYVDKMLEVGKKYMVFGRPTYFRGEYSIPHPEIAVLDDSTQQELNTTGIQPVYPSTEKLRTKNLHSRGIEKLIKTLFTLITEKDVPENLNSGIINKFHFDERFAAYEKIHIPADEASAEKAKNRFRFEELFFSQLRIVRLKVGRTQKENGFVFKHLGNFFNTFYNKHLPFELTNAQKRVVKEIRADVLSKKQMNRLLQGDVGSGKTIVALLIILMALDNGFQSCLMVPTEILAQQHYRNLQRVTEGLGIKIGFLAASVKGKDRKMLFEKLSSGEIHLLVGTHALLEDQVIFKNLGLVIIDEQHRFGVEQRARLWTKNYQPPHVLVMTATPIPRTLAMTLYGDLDVSVIDELPPGRKPVKTVHRNDAARLRVFGFMREEIKNGRQIYVVYPLIEESEKQDYKYLIDGFESIARAFPLPEFAVSIVHGKMKSEEREFEMQRFIKGETQIMIATTVIEVGVDVPNASVMVIESAERFGLSQLHQLRGRVGRGADQSFCILMSGEKISADALARLQIMTQTSDGFVIAEEDMRLRGPGNIEGTQQSGLMPFKIADLIRDQKWLIAAREEAEKILASDSSLAQPQHQMIRSFLTIKRNGEKEWSMIS